MMEQPGKGKIELQPIGVVRRSSPEENERDRQLLTRVVVDEALIPALDGIGEWLHLYVIFWLDRVNRPVRPLHHRDSAPGVLAA